jgi:hypothetical protein
MKKEHLIFCEKTGNFKNQLLKFNGTWIKEIGDGVLVSFHTVIDAVMCSMEIQKACNNINDLKLRNWYSSWRCSV